MSLLSDLLDFVKTRMPDGCSFGEIQGFLEIEDKVELRNLINDGLNKCMLSKTGEKRGTRYLAVEGANCPVEDTPDDIPIIGNKALDVYLNGSTPVHDAVIVHIENIITFIKPKNLLEFIQNGRKIISYTISYDREKQKNIIVNKQEMLRMNYFSITKDLIIEKFDQVTGLKESIACDGDYEQLREQLRIILR